jgi:hypothetical protein
VSLRALADRLLGRDRFDLEVGRDIVCPSRAGWLYAGACSPCPFWVRTETDAAGRTVVVCRARALAGGLRTRV